MKQIQLNGYVVELSRSSRRKTVGLSLTAEGRIRVAAPSGLSDNRVAQFLAKKETWLRRKLQEREEAWSRIREGMAFFLGETYPMEMAAGGTGVEMVDGRIKVGGPDSWEELKAWYHQQARELIGQRVQEHARRLRLEVEEVDVREWRSRWGECRPGGVLRFNWRLILLPTEVVNYVVFHELVHLLEPGHTKRFWRFMASVAPAYASHREWLRRFGTPLLLWRPGSPGQAMAIGA